MPDAQWSDNPPPDEYIQRFLQEHTASLKKVLCAYVLRMGLARGANVRLVADEAFQDAVLEIVAHGERFMSVPQPRSWFLAVAANVLKRKRASFAKRYRFEVLVSDLAANSAQFSEADILEQLTTSSISGPEQILESCEQVREMLALVSPEDAQVLRLALLHELDTASLARELGISAGAARVRLHRALKRLRVAWQQESKRQGRSDW